MTKYVTLYETHNLTFTFTIAHFNHTYIHNMRRFTHPLPHPPCRVLLVTEQDSIEDSLGHSKVDHHLLIHISTARGHLHLLYEGRMRKEGEGTANWAR